MLDFLKKTEYSHQAVLCQSGTASVSSRSALLARGAKTLPSCDFYGASALWFDSSTFFFLPPPCFHFLSISYFDLLWRKALDVVLSEAVLFLAQTHNGVCKDDKKKAVIRTKEHTCYALIVEVNLHTSVPVPLNRQPEVQAWLSAYTQSSLWLCGLKHCLECLFWVARWNSCTMPGDAHGRHSKWRFFCWEDNRGVIFPWCIRGGCKWSRWGCDIVSHCFVSPLWVDLSVFRTLLCVLIWVTKRPVFWKSQYFKVSQDVLWILWILSAAVIRTGAW